MMMQNTPTTNQRRSQIDLANFKRMNKTIIRRSAAFRYQPQFNRRKTDAIRSDSIHLIEQSVVNCHCDAVAREIHYHSID